MKLTPCGMLVSAFMYTYIPSEIYRITAANLTSLPWGIVFKVNIRISSFVIFGESTRQTKDKSFKENFCWRREEGDHQSFLLT